jgi:transcriptional regulator with XRE-family HTH domain
MTLTPRQEFGQVLRQVRDASGKQAKQIAEAVGIDPGLASRYELGQRWPKPDLVIAWAHAAGLSASEGADLVEQLAEARQRDGNLRSTAKYRPKAAQAARSRLYADTSRIRSFAIAGIPWYLQSAEYARQEVGESEPDVNDIVAMRQADGNTVGAPGKYFEIILAESALRFLPCDRPTMRGQLGRLHGLVGVPGVEFGIVPFGVPLVTRLKNSFSVYDDIATIDTFAGEVTHTPKEAQRYIALMDRLWDEAVRGEAVREFLTAAANALPDS